MVNVGEKLRLHGEVLSVVTCLSADDIISLAESEGDLQRIVNEFCSVCKRRKFKVHSGKSKVMVLEQWFSNYGSRPKSGSPEKF